jgi:hypothetical protein
MGITAESQNTHNMSELSELPGARIMSLRRLSALLFATFAVPASSSALLAAEQLAQAAPAAAAKAGIAAAVRGEVQLVAVPGVREVGRNVSSGDVILLGDQITTGPEGRLQIMLQDETVFTIGPNAALVIDRFVYDPQTNAGKVSASVLKGTFRFVTGKVAKREPSDMEVKLPVGSIGVRGTSVAGEVSGTRSTIVLLGPGVENDAGERIGRVLVNGPGPNGAISTVEIVRPGFASEIAGVNIPPTAAVRLDPARMASLTAPLAGTGPRPAAQPAAPSGQGGQSQGGARQAVNVGPSIATQGGVGVSKGVQNVQIVTGRPPGPGPRPAPGGPILGGPGLPPPPPPPPQFVPDGQTNFDQLRSISGGSAVFAVNNAPLAVVNGTGVGSYNYSMTVNFGARTSTLNFSLNNYQIGGITPQNFTHNDPSESYANKTGIVGGGSPLSVVNSAGGANDRIVVADIPRNVNGKIAAVMDLKVEVYTNGAASCAAATNCIRGTSVIPRTP